MKTIGKAEFENFVDDLIENDPREVVGVKSKGSKFAFGPLKSSEELRLDYDVTMLPPKKYFMPPRETILRFKKSPYKISVEPVVEVEPKIIVGIHPYDLIAIEQMDKIFSDTYEDANYLTKREKCFLIGVNMENVSEWSFAGSMGTATTKSGYDLMLTHIDDKYTIEIGSSKGSELIENVPMRSAKSEEIAKVREKKEKIVDKFEKKLDFPVEELPTILEENYDNMEFWEKNSEKCFSCASCNLVCPTCYCFDLEELSHIDMTEGHRKRRWDGCLIREFAAVASGENFRRTRAERYRHRYMRKGKYIHDKYGDISCVGCGRCGSHCIPDIADPCKIFNKLKEGEM